MNSIYAAMFSYVTYFLLHFLKIKTSQLWLCQCLDNEMIPNWKKEEKLEIFGLCSF